jgi:hypothetical protein
MRITLQRAEDNLDVVRHFLAVFRAKTAASTERKHVDPLPYAFYLLAFPSGGGKPEGMVEFFFLDQAFDCYKDCPYPQAVDLSRLAPLSQVIYLRSVIVDNQSNGRAAVRFLGESLIFIASTLGARYLTANTGIDLTVLQGLTHDGNTMPSNSYDTDAEFSVLTLDWAPRRTPPVQQCGAISDELQLARTIRRRGRREVAAASNAGPKLDKLLPAHWVGVWQRQLRAYAW